jgi:Polyketide cyclase / dehydrase and lipid transport
MIVQLLGILAALLVVIAVYAWIKPKTFRIERTAVINAPPETIHEYLADFRKWGGWSPWEALDPDMVRTYKGPGEGVGAGYAWEGRKAGSGNMLITQSDPQTGISLDLNFTKPFKANNQTDITLTKEGDNTRVNWAMYGPHPYLHRLMSVVFSMDKMVGKDFEKGLAKLKSLSEG